MDEAKFKLEIKTWVMIFIILFLVLSSAVLAVLSYQAEKKISAVKERVGLLGVIQKKVIDKNFLLFQSYKESLPEGSEPVSLIAVGDIMLSRNVAQKIKANGPDYPFAKTKDYLQSGDVVFGNLETALTPGREIKTGEATFRADPNLAFKLKEVGFNILSLANNHTPNFGGKGLADTFNFLEQAGIPYVGAGANEKRAYEPIFVEKKGIKFAFLAYNDSDVVPADYEASTERSGTAFMDKDQMMKAVAEAKQQADFVVVSMHSGTEYTVTPNNRQTEFAHAAIEAGAEIVIGHHPHVVQIAEEYKGKYILYSLGNFIFDQMWSQETREGVVAKIFFSKESGVTKIDFRPIIVEDYSQPRFLTGAPVNQILQRLNIPLTNQPTYQWDKEAQSFKAGNSLAIIRDSVPTKLRKVIEDDLDGNGQKERYILEDGRLYVFAGSERLWQSEKKWWVDNFVLADLNNDGRKEVDVSLWKTSGEEVKNYLSIFSFTGDKLRLIWESKALTNPNCELVVGDFNADNQNELAALAGDYSADYSCQGKDLVVSKWQLNGFSEIWRSEDGSYSQLVVDRLAGQDILLVVGK